MLSHTATGEWQSFEARMRRRRAERLLLRAEAAVSAGSEDEARVCLAEARTLAPDLPEISAVEAALARRSEPVPIAIPALTLPATGPQVRSAFILCASVAILLAAFLAGWLAYRDVPDVTEVLPAKVEAAGRSYAHPAPPLDAEGPAPEPVKVATAPTTGAGVSIATADLREPPAAPPSLGTTEGLPTLPDAAPASSAELPLAPREPSSVPTPAAPSAGLAGTVLPPPSVDVNAPVVEPAQEQLVQAVLNRYAAAYSSLDVDAAVRVWPSVNRAALARAFGGLATQSVGLRDCRIDVTGNTARARCDGSATWSPKVGSGTHTESRAWTFDLARVPGGWQILNARAQNR